MRAAVAEVEKDQYRAPVDQRGDPAAVIAALAGAIQQVAAEAVDLLHFCLRLLHRHRSPGGGRSLDRVDQLVAPDGQVEVDVERFTPAEGTRSEERRVGQEARRRRAMTVW